MITTHQFGHSAARGRLYCQNAAGSEVSWDRADESQRPLYLAAIGTIQTSGRAQEILKSFRTDQATSYLWMKEVLKALSEARVFRGRTYEFRTAHKRKIERHFQEQRRTEIDLVPKVA